MQKLFVLLSILIVSIVGCKSNDEKARELHNQAISANREGRSEEAALLLEKIVQKYPETETAVEANQYLAAREIILDMSKETRKKTIDMALQLYRLDNGCYPSTEQGVRALVEMPEVGDPPRKWRGGYVENASILEIVDNYESDGTQYDLTIK